MNLILDIIFGLLGYALRLKIGEEKYDQLSRGLSVIAFILFFVIIGGIVYIFPYLSGIGG